MTKISSQIWERLHHEATLALGKAYAPYSKYPVGAAAYTADGRFFSGCNVENASYGLTLCAECSLISQLIMAGGGQLVAFVCLNGEKEVIVPCGRCRQLLYEHGGAELEIEMPRGVTTMEQVLPCAFGPEDLT